MPSMSAVRRARSARTGTALESGLESGAGGAPGSAVQGELLRVKQRLYTLIVVMLLFALLVSVAVAAVMGSGLLRPAATIGAGTLVMGGAVLLLLRDPRRIRLMEGLGIGTILLYVLVWDILNLTLPHMPSVQYLTTTPIVLMLAGLTLSLSLTGRWQVPALIGIYVLHAVPAWADLLRFPWSVLHSGQVISDLVLLTGLLSLTLLGTFQRLSGAAQRDAQTMRELAHTDEVTGLPNRRAMYRALAAPGPHALIMIDLDDFKRVNDLHGHRRGDEVLHAVGRILHATLGSQQPEARTQEPRRRGTRRQEPQPQQTRQQELRGCVGRWGGEEYLIVLPRADLRAATDLAERLRVQVERLTPHPAPITLSVGVTVQRPHEEIDAAVSRADALMYRAKQQGKNRVEAGS